MKKKIAIYFAPVAALVAIALLVGCWLGKKTAERELHIAEPTEEETAEPWMPDWNTITKEELILLPGVGEKTADAILAYREENGGIVSVYELESVKGIGAEKLERIVEYLQKGKP